MKMEPIPQSVAAIIDLLCATAEREALALPTRRRVVTAVRGAILPKGKPGRKPHGRIDTAYADYKAGLRGLELFRRHIPNFKKLSRWRRVAEQNKLRRNLEKRAERERKRPQRVTTNNREELSPRQSSAENCQPDNSAL